MVDCTILPLREIMQLNYMCICERVFYFACQIYPSPNIVRVIRTRRMRWAGHVARIGERRGACRVLVVKPERKRPLGRRRHRWEDNIKMDMKALWLVYVSPGLKFRNSTFCPQRAYICSGLIWGQTAIVSLYRLVFLTEIDCVYCAVRTEPLYTMEVSFALERVNVSLSMTGWYEMCFTEWQCDWCVKNCHC